MLSLRLLEPTTDIDLFRQAYNWRLRPKRHIQPDRMPFEDFIDPNGLAVGLFNGELLAVYFLHETEPSKFQCHFTSCRKVSREILLRGAQKVAARFLESGATELHAWVTPRNRALRGFLEALGFAPAETKSFPKNKDSEPATVLPFVKYVLSMDQSDRIKRQKAEQYAE